MSQYPCPQLMRKWNLIASEAAETYTSSCTDSLNRNALLQWTSHLTVSSTISPVYFFWGNSYRRVIGSYVLDSTWHCHTFKFTQLNFPWKCQKTVFQLFMTVEVLFLQESQVLIRNCNSGLPLTQKISLQMEDLRTI